jgi:hypothetical protein
MVDIGLFISALGVGFGVTMFAWFFAWGITKVVNLFKLIVKV